MIRLKPIITILIIGIFTIYACGDDNEPVEEYNGNLSELMSLNNYSESDEVIACAGSNSAGDSVYVFFYPEMGATDFRYFEADITSDGNKYASYNEIKLGKQLLLNDYLYRFNRGGEKEGWGIVTFMLNGKLHASNPILFKQLNKATEYTNASLNIEFNNSKSPQFLWEDGKIKENEIYYEIVMDSERKVLSATYTYDKNYTYYNTSNVVLDLSNPANVKELAVSKSYTIAVMGISIDNWINLFIEKEFTVPN